MSVIDDEIITDDDDNEVILCNTCGYDEDTCDCITCFECAEKVSTDSGDMCSICETACVGCCRCCSECGSGECQCCPDCGGPCGCEGDGFGHSKNTPWEQRGIRVNTAKNSTTNWKMIWPEIDADNFDLCREASDFYVLEAITNGLVNSDKVLFNKAEVVRPTKDQLYRLIGVHGQKAMAALGAHRTDTERRRSHRVNPLEETLASILADAQSLFETRINRADEILRAYFHMAVAGEARHHTAMKGRVLSANRDRAWSGWRSIYDQVGPEALLDLASLFLEFTGGSYGGGPWADACKILHSREMGNLGPTDFLNKKMFVDRAWTLEHNGGCFLNKIPWACENPAGWDVNRLKEKVLNSHASNPPNWRMLLRAASEEVCALWDQVWEIQNELRGVYNENPRTVIVPSRALCRGCHSDPTKGHFARCQVRIYYPDFDGVVDLKKPKPWYQIAQEDEWHDGFAWQAWEKSHIEDNLFYGPDFSLKNPDQPVRLRITFAFTGYVEQKETDGVYPLHSDIYLNNSFLNHDKTYRAEELIGKEFDIVEHLASIKFAVEEQAVKQFNIQVGAKCKKEGLRITFPSVSIEWISDFGCGYLTVNEPFNLNDKSKNKPKVITITTGVS